LERLSDPDIYWTVRLAEILGVSPVKIAEMDSSEFRANVELVARRDKYVRGIEEAEIARRKRG
jgi:hypothetical protein